MLEEIVKILAKTDPKIKYVWEHYTVNKQTDLLPIADIQYFWDTIQKYAEPNGLKIN